ncbi:MAG: anti-sigma factor [Pseudomonadota bacterium]|nr:anti-sigma factor [Pseudomonadota bacterium]
MSGRVLRFEGSTHHEADRLLPWLVNGTLDEDERALVEQHLAECATCQHELDWLRSLESACAEESPPTSDLARSQRRLRRRLGMTQGQGRHGWGRKAAWLPWAVAAQAVLVLVMLLGVALLAIQRPPTQRTYHTLGAVQTAQARLVIVFDPQVSEGQMRRLLRASDARIVYGPTDAGAYVLSVPAARAITVREALRAAPGITLVESLGPGAER